MTVHAPAPQSQHEARAATGWFLGIVAFMIVVAPSVPGLPFVGPLVALRTPVRRTRWQMATLWGLAALHVVQLVLLLLAVTDSWPEWLMFDDEEHSL